ncbi:MAG: rhomboid family intramembrane serine protease [Rhizobiales bacterium]|nr:rhomboid family intramembrane serine protease [Hyphomicrobiales bacterium]
MNQTSEPIFNVPPVVIGTIVVLALIHGLRVWLLPPFAEHEFILLFAFIPARYDPSFVLPGGLPGATGAEIWTFVTYALIHADALHLGLNALWLLPFGSALARRLGAGRFLAFLVVTAAAGSGAHLAMHFGETYPMVGASAAISGTMAAAMRFAFQRGGPLSAWHSRDNAAYHVPAVSLLGALRDPRFLAFVAVWFGINAVFGLGGLQLDNGQTVAWEAHIGGFVAGLLLFSLFDPVERRRSYSDTQY